MAINMMEINAALRKLASGASVTLSRSACSTSTAGTELRSLSGLTEAAEMGCGALAGASSPPAAGDVPVHRAE